MNTPMNNRHIMSTAWAGMLAILLAMRMPLEKRGIRILMLVKPKSSQPQ